MLRNLILALFMTLPFFASAEPIAVGADAPRIKATAETGKSIDLGALYDKGPVLVYFYPKADTPGCTAQACNLRDNFTALQEKGVTVVGVSMDDVADQEKFHSKYSLPFTLIADKEGAVVKVFGVPSTMGFAKRQAYLVVGGKIVWRDLAAKPATQTQDALGALASVKK